MIGNKEECLDPWVGFFIIFIVCVMILAAITEHGVNSRHKAHHGVNQGDVRGQIISPGPGANSPTKDMVVF